MNVLKDKYGYLLTLLFTGAIFIYWDTNGYSGGILLNRLTQTFGVLAIVYLYIVMMIGAVYAVWTSLKGKPVIFSLRKQLGVSTFVVSLVHGAIAFFGQLGGVGGLEFLTSRYLTALVLSTLALVFLGVMAFTSFPPVQKLIGVWWKRTHKLIYVVAILVIFHVLIIGTHYRDLRDSLSQLSMWALAILLVLESVRVDRYLQKKFPSIFKLNLFLIVSAVTIALIIAPVYTRGGLQPFSVHNRHNANADGLSRYNVTYSTADVIVPGQPVEFEFKIYDSLSGEVVNNFTPVNNQLMHINVVDSDLETLNDYHPVFLNGSFFEEIQLPHAGKFYFFLKFYPSEGSEQEVQISIDLRDEKTNETPDFTIDANAGKNANGYTVIFDQEKPLLAKDISEGNQLINFELFNAETNEPVENIPFYGATSSIILVNTQTKYFIMGHATNLRPSKSYLQANPRVSPDIVEHSHVGGLDLRPFEFGGPQIQFQMVDPYGKITPGIYRIFVTFQPGGDPVQTIFTTEIR